MLCHYPTAIQIGKQFPLDMRHSVASTKASPDGTYERGRVALQPSQHSHLSNFGGVFQGVF